MKHLWMTVGCLLAVALLSLACATDNDKVSEVREVDSFSSIEIASVATVCFTQGAECSLKIEGKEKIVKNTATQVKDDCLVIGFRENNKKLKLKNSMTIYLTAPDLKRVKFSGVGSFTCEKPLKLDDVALEVEGVGSVDMADLTCRKLKVAMEGVGKVNIHVNCDYLDADLNGVGSVVLSGKAGEAGISKNGIGRMNTKKLVVGK